MGLFLFLLELSRVTIGDGNILRDNSRFALLREFAGEGLICSAVFAAERRLRSEKSKLPGSSGKTGNFVRRTDLERTRRYRSTGGGQ
jgi:hypothetical protein